MVIDLDEPRRNERPVWMPAIIGVLAFVLGGIGGYALGLGAGPSMPRIEAISPVNAGRVDLEIREADRRIATCETPSGFARAFDYCMGQGPWDATMSP